jgi:hypothetical protein
MPEAEGENPRRAEPRYYWSIEHRCDPETLRIARAGIPPLSPEEVQALPVVELVRRMDALWAPKTGKGSPRTSGRPSKT